MPVLMVCSWSMAVTRLVLVSGAERKQTNKQTNKQINKKRYQARRTQMIKPFRSHDLDDDSPL